MQLPESSSHTWHFPNHTCQKAVAWIIVILNISVYVGKQSFDEYMGCDFDRKNCFGFHACYSFAWGWIITVRGRWWWSLDLCRKTGLDGWNSLVMKLTLHFFFLWKEISKASKYSIMLCNKESFLWKASLKFWWVCLSDLSLHNEPESLSRHHAATPYWSEYRAFSSFFGFVYKIFFARYFYKNCFYFALPSGVSTRPFQIPE